MDLRRPFNQYDLYHQSLYHPHQHYHHRPPSTVSEDESEHTKSRFRWIISLGLLLPALAAIIGVVAWAVSAEVVIGARREAALKASDQLRFPQSLQRVREDEEVLNDDKTLRISSIWEKEDDLKTHRHNLNTGHDPDEGNEEDGGEDDGQDEDPNAGLKTITSSTTVSSIITSSSSSTTSRPVPILFQTFSPTSTQSPTLPPLTTRSSSSSRNSLSQSEKMSKKDNIIRGASGSVTTKSPNDVFNGVRSRSSTSSTTTTTSPPVTIMTMASADSVKSPKKSPGEHVVEVINRLIAQRKNFTGTKPQILVIAPIRNQKTTPKPIQSPITKSSRIQASKSTTTVGPTDKPNRKRKGSTTRNPKRTTTKKIEVTEDPLSETPTAFPVLSKDAETLLAAAHVLAARHKTFSSRNDEEDDVQHKEAPEQKFQKFEAVIDMPQEGEKYPSASYPVYQFEPITQTPSYVSYSNIQPEIQRTPYRRHQHSSSRMGSAPSPAASQNVQVLVSPNPIIEHPSPAPIMPSNAPPIVPHFGPTERRQFGAPLQQPPQMHPQFHFVQGQHLQVQGPNGPHIQNHLPPFMVNHQFNQAHGQQSAPGGHFLMPPQLQMQLPPNAPRPLMGLHNFNHGHNNNFNPQTGQFAASGSDLNPHMSRPSPPPAEEETEEGESVVSNSGITQGNQADGSSPTGMLSLQANEPAPSYQQHVASESAPSKGLTLHFGGGPVGGGGQLITSPVGIFKTLLLPLLPRPRVNLNGKVVFGVVLEKGVGFGKQKPNIVTYQPSHFYRH